MNKFLKWTMIVSGMMIVFSALVGLVLYQVGAKQLLQNYPNIEVGTITIPVDADAIARGRHVSVIWACTKCHGADLSGTLFTKDPIEGIIPLNGILPASNLTSGLGGVGQVYTNADWVRAIRHGVKPNGQVEVFMNVSTMSDRDLVDLIAYLKQIPPVDAEYPAVNYGPIVPITSGLGFFPPVAGLLDHNAPHPADPEPGATAEYGEYLSAICAQCHGAGIANAMKNWKQDDFKSAFHTGVRLDGTKLNRPMSSETFRELNDMELTALWLYFTSIKP